MKKKIILCLFTVCLFSCLKVQKKSDLDKDSKKIEATELLDQEEKDLIIYRLDQPLSLINDTEIIADEVYLMSNAKIYTNQYNLKITTSKFYAVRGSSIQSFSDENKIADVEMLGQSGGLVQIKTGVASGVLQVQMSGQSGGPGKGGWTFFRSNNVYETGAWRDRACAPNSGADSGESGSFFMESDQSDLFFISTAMILAKGGLIGPIYDKQDYIDFIPNRNHIYKQVSEDCYNEPIAGRDGSLGQICTKLKLSENPICKTF